MSDSALSRITLDGSTAESDIAAYIDGIRDRPQHRDHLVALLPQGHALYAGRGANQVVRIRGYVLASFELTGLPELALVYVLEELENSQKPYLVAAAAKALRGMSAPSSELVPFLLAAITNIQYRDDALSFESYTTTWPLQNHTTALIEILHTFEHLGIHARSALPALEAMQTSPVFNTDIRRRTGEAIRVIRSDTRQVPQDCCSVPTGKCRAPVDRVNCRDAAQVSDIRLEDQDGRTLTFAEAFCGKPTVAAFFYTRCENPNKCSLTVTKLGQLQNEFMARKLNRRVRIAAMTYDPGHDTAERLRGYCENRGFRFDADNCAWRADKSRFDAVRSFFDLGANYSGSVVSRHRIELFILNEDGKVVTSYANLQWDVQDVADDVNALLAEEPRPIGSHTTSQSGP